MKTKSLFYLSLIGLLLYGCVAKKVTIKTYINSSLNTSKITSVAIFPLRNGFVQRDANLGTGDMIEINKVIHQEFSSMNPKASLVTAVTSIDSLNKGNLVNSYDTLLRVYEYTGIPNTVILNKIGKKLNVGAIIQGFVREITQKDGVYGGNRGETRITLKYVMFSTNTGDVLWEATITGYKGTATTLAKAPPISDVIEIIKKKIITGMPKLSE